jgi:hypothetical protein
MATLQYFAMRLGSIECAWSLVQRIWPFLWDRSLLKRQENFGSFCQMLVLREAILFTRLN